MSGSGTESAENIWGNPVPYLVSVSSEEARSADRISNYETESRFTSENFKSILADGGFHAEFSDNSDNIDNINDADNAANWIERVELNSSGRVDYIVICGEKISGVRLRELFSLRSTDFTIKTESAQAGDSVFFIFTVRGYGHGVGLSQVGANLMAMEGSSYADILKWYYTGVEINPVYLFFD
jgi:stage II sporulation protein D